MNTLLSREIQQNGPPVGSSNCSFSYASVLPGCIATACDVPNTLRGLRGVAETPLVAPDRRQVRTMDHGDLVAQPGCEPHL
jgi:hypothetical protein